MDDLNQKISEILSDPQALEQIKGLGEMLGLNNASNESVHNKPENTDIAPKSVIGANSPDMMGMVTKLAPIMSSLNKEDDTTRLLFALRPFLSPQRQKKLDEAGKLLKMMKLLPLIKDLNLLDSLF